MKAFLFIKEIFTKYPLLLLFTVILLTIMGFFSAFSLFTITPIIDFYLHPDLNNMSPLSMKAIQLMEFINVPMELKYLLIFFVLFVSLSCVFRVLARALILKIKYAVMKDIIIGIFKDFFNARWYFFCRNKQGVLINTLNRELTVVGNAFSAMGLFFANVIQMSFFLLVPLYISWQVTLISLGLGLILSLPFSFLTRLTYNLGKLNTSTANQFNSVIYENLALAKVVLGCGNYDRAIANLQHAFEAHCNVTIKSQVLNLAILISYRPMGIIMIIIVMFIARWFSVPVSEMSVLLLALFQSALSIGNMNAQKNSLVNFFPSYEQIQLLRKQAKQMRQVSGGKKFKGFYSEIRLDRVSFSYINGICVLDNINVRIPKGQMIAFVGKSGSGKSTLIDIIMGFHDPIEGRVFFDDTPLGEYDITSYRKRIGYVPQESVLFNMSIRDNLLWAKSDATDAEIKAACRAAYADVFIEQFPERYETIVGDRGVRLSGGQVQRIALARALIRKPELLILDEATSSLDTHSERLIQQAIEDVSKDTTVIVVAHRLSTIKNADYVYVLENGRIIEEGGYGELLKGKTSFRLMAELQGIEGVKRG